MTSPGGSARTRDLVRTALLAAACAAVGYLFSFVPNIELLSAAVFACGAIVGVRRGATIGFLAEAVYAGFNRYGVSPPPLYAAQVIGFALIGAGGGLARPILARASWIVQALVAGACGFVLTLAYDVLTNAAIWVTARESASFAAIVLGGLSFPFPLAHASSNTVGFALVVPAVVRAVRRRMGRPALPIGVIAGLGSMLAAVAAPAVAQIPPLVPAGGPRGQVLHRADWVHLEPLTVEDLLRTLTGVAMARSGALGSPELVSLGGSTNGRVQVVLDGVDISEPDFAWPRVIPVQIGMLDSLEIVRTTDPARIALWSRHSENTAPHADFDFGRGELGSRTRRVQLVTPPRALEVALCYEELLRRGDDFRPVPTIDTAADLGEYAGRTVLARIGLRRGSGSVRVEHLDGSEESHGSVASQADRLRSRMARSTMRWEQPFGEALFVLDVGHTAWSRLQVVDGLERTPEDARTHASFDLLAPETAGLQPALRFRHATVTGVDTIPQPVRRTLQQDQVEIAIGRPGPIRLDVAAGAHRDTRSDATWSARGAASFERGDFALGIQGGRGVAWTGWRESGVERIGYDASVIGTWRRGARTLRLEATAKRLEGGASSPALVPDAGRGPDRIAGGVFEARWRGTRGQWTGDAGIGAAWTPYLEGDPAGMPEVQARFDLAGARRFARGDLVVTLRTTWTVDGARTFPSGDIPAEGLGDVMAEAVFLRRLDFFAGLRNLLDAEGAQTYPGVVLPDRLFWFGARVRLLD